MEKRSFGLLCVLLVLFTAPAWSGGSSASQGTSPVNTGVKGTGPHYWLVKYDRPVTLHTVNVENTDNDFIKGETVENNAWTKGLKDTLNINVVTDWVTTRTEYETKLNLAIASGQLPDVFQVNTIQFRQLVEAGMIADITDYLEANVADSLKEFMRVSPEITESAKQNGRLYGMPVFGYGSLSVPNELWLRHDWMQTARVSAPKTIADMENLMKTFIQAHPGTYGMPLNKSLEELYQLSPAFRAYPGIWITGPDGKSIVYGGVQPEMREVLRTFADWYTKGYLKRDFMSMDSAAVRQDLVSGKFGVQVFAQWWGFGNGADVVNNLGKEAYFEAYELPSRDGSPVIHPLPFDNSNYLVINKNCKNIDAALKAMSFYRYILFDGVVSGDVTYAEMKPYFDLMHLPIMLETADPIDEVRQYDQVQQAIKTGNTSGITSATAKEKYDYAKRYLDSGDTTGIGHWLQLYAATSAYATNSKVVNENRFVLSRMLGAPPEELGSLGSTLDDLLKEGFAKIVIGQEPLSYFDTLVRQWRSAGGDAATAAMNRDYGKK